MPDHCISSFGPLHYVLMQELWALGRRSARMTWGDYIRATIARLRRS
ncbi:MAG TPA: hypothetical protein VFU22_07115 [Roseiflexaceae bacterium]|nr:hypothetical protein [Roseiflexaceae bacterium]